MPGLIAETKKDELEALEKEKSAPKENYAGRY